MNREEAIKICKQVRKYFNGGKLATDDTDAIYEALSEAVEALQEQKTGKWITKSDRNPCYASWWYECSECGNKPLLDVYRQDSLSDYCPNCGARMEQEEGD